MSGQCPTCSAPVADDDRFCEGCGARIGSAGLDTRDGWELDLGIVAGVTDRGRVHLRNEDALFINTTGDSAVAVVSDGVSSSRNPHHAAQLAADAAGRALAEALEDRDARPVDLTWDPTHEMVDAIARAQEIVTNIATPESTVHLPSACTLVSALWDGDRFTVGWIGDSRAYWIGVGEATCLTADDSWAQEQLDAGAMTQRTALADPRAHQITRWLGADATDAAARTTTFTPPGPGRVVLCSDGLWNYAPTATQLAALLAEVPARAHAADVALALLRAALASGGHDNVTIAVMSVNVPV